MTDDAYIAASENEVSHETGQGKPARRGPGRPAGRKVTEPISFRAVPGFAARIAAFADLVGESQSEYIRTAIEQRNKREARRKPVEQARDRLR